MLKRLFARFAAAGAALAFCAAAMAAPLPSMNAANSSINPAIINDFNLFLNQLNGGLGYSGVSQVVSLGQACSNSGAVSTLTCNGQRGQLSYTSGVTITTTGSVQTFTITNSFVTTASLCQAWFGAAFTAGSGVTVATVVPTANTLTIIGVNAGTTANAVTTATLNFSCVN